MHHVMARGIERRQIFWDDHDRDDFVDRLAGLVKDRLLTVYAWALIPNHFSCGAPASRHSAPRSSWKRTKKLEPSFWELEREHLHRQMDRYVRPALASGEVSHLSVFGLAPIPLLISLGVELSDIPAAEVYQLHREPPTWKWQPDSGDVKYEVSSEYQSASKTVALVLALSADIERQRVADVLGADISLWHITHKSPHNDFLQSRSQLQLFREALRRTFNEIKKVHGEDAQLHVFPAIPVACAVEVGRVWMQKVDLPFVVYDQNRKSGGFCPAVTIQQAD
jgi:hypothetical protein